MRLLYLMLLQALPFLAADTPMDYFSSVTGLEELLVSEELLVNVFENYLAEKEKVSDKLSKFLDEIEQLAGKAIEDPARYYQNPLNGFRLIKRLVHGWKQIEKLVVNATVSEDANINKLPSEMPTNDDLEGAAKGIDRLQSTYKLKTEDIVDGILLDFIVSTKLSASDCFYLARALYGLNNKLRAREWFIFAKAQLEKELNATNYQLSFPYVSNVHILEFLAPAFFDTGNPKMALLLNSELLAEDPNNFYGLKNQQLYEQTIIEERHQTTTVKSVTTAADNKILSAVLYEKVCRGELTQTPAEQRDLRCRYFTNNVPFCLIAPFKMEELNHDPFVAFYHEAIYDSEIQQILDVAETELERSMVGDIGFQRYEDLRVSKQTWLWYEDTTFIADIKQRLLDITGLSMTSAEPLQVANYGIGGHYGPHHDFSEDPDATYNNRGNRILTALFYINEVELGGATAFPFLHIAAKPIRRSLLVWYNMHESLELDYRTLHAGCPVILGSKWICNEWFHQIGQEFIRPCCLERNGNKSIEYRHK